MESQYKELLAKSKTVGDFYETVYAPVLQTIPWIDDGIGLKNVSEKVLGNIAFPAHELSSYKNQHENQQIIDGLRARCNELDSIYEQMRSELQPLLAKIPPQDRAWEKVQEMVTRWKDLSSPNLLPNSMHKSVEDSFCPSLSVTAVTSTNIADQDVLGILMAEKIKSLQANGESDHDIAVKFGSHGLWLDRGFLNSLRYGKFLQTKKVIPTSQKTSAIPETFCKATTK